MPKERKEECPKSIQLITINAKPINYADDTPNFWQRRVKRWKISNCDRNNNNYIAVFSPRLRMYISNKKSKITKFKGVGNFRACNAVNGVSERKFLIRSEKIQSGNSCIADETYSFIYTNIYAVYLCIWQITNYVYHCVDNVHVQQTNA